MMRNHSVGIDWTRTRSLPSKFGCKRGEFGDEQILINAENLPDGESIDIDMSGLSAGLYLICIHETGVISFPGKLSLIR